MSTNDTSGSTSQPPSSHAGAIVIGGIIALGVVWTYILVGKTGLGYWMKAGASVVILTAMIAAWRWRQKRIAQQLELLQRWAADDDARRQRKPARRS